MEYEKLSQFDNHERVETFTLNIDDTPVFCCIALHRIRSGISIGGTRMLPYASEEEAVTDALNLSKGMTYKCIHANLPYGGGKGVIMADPTKVNVAELLSQYAAKVNELNGSFYTGEDVGLDKEAVEILGNNSRYIIGLPSKTGIPAPYAAEGVYVAMRAALEKVAGSSALSGKVIAIKGLGAVGSDLARRLLEEGAIVHGADIDVSKVVALQNGYENFVAAEVGEIHTTKVDVYSPCALGYDISTERANTIAATIVCGAANNQLADEKAGQILFDRNIVYVPDYVANAGGLIHVADELEVNGYDEARVHQRIAEIGEQVGIILDISLKKGLNSDTVARQIAAQLAHD